MSKDITEDILLKDGFINTMDDTFKLFFNGASIILYYTQPPFGRCWTCLVDTTCNMSKTDIQTIDHFNKLMDLMDIDFKLKEE